MRPPQALDAALYAYSGIGARIPCPTCERGLWNPTHRCPNEAETTMPNTNHYEIAERLLLEGERVVQRIMETSPDDRNRRDDFGKQAMGIWAQAQAHATLAAIPPRDRDKVKDVIHASLQRNLSSLGANQVGWLAASITRDLMEVR